MSEVRLDSITGVYHRTEGEPVGSCIYCGATGDLSDEHVIPYSLGGNYILPKASCGDCAKITSAFEQRVTRGFMLAARAAGTFPTRHPKDRPKWLPLELQVGNEYFAHEVPVSDYPGILMLPIFTSAGFLQRRRISQGVEIIGHDEIAFGKLPVDAVRALGGSGMRITFNWDITDYARLLAKAALGFAVARLGPLPVCEVPVIPLILGKSDDASRWIGSERFRLAVEDKNPRHAVGLQVMNNPEDSAKKIIVVRLKLFADCGATGYEIIAWTPERLDHSVFRRPSNH